MKLLEDAGGLLWGSKLLVGFKLLGVAVGVRVAAEEVGGEAAGLLRKLLSKEALAGLLRKDSTALMAADLMM